MNASRPVRPPNRLIASLEDATRRHPTERKLLVCRERGEGRELLRLLAVRLDGWMGWEAATLRDLAAELAFVSLAERGMRTLDGIEQAAIVDAALDRAIERRGKRSVFAALADGLGFRKAVAGALEALRLNVVEPGRLHSAADGRPKIAELGLVLEEYLARLEELRLADPAAILAAAIESFESELPLLDARCFLVPGLGTRGLSGALLARLLAAGAVLLESDPVIGLEPPPGRLVHPNGSSAAPGIFGTFPAPARDVVRSALQREQLELPLADALQGGREGIPTCLSWLHAPDAMPVAVEPLAIDFFRASSPSVEVREVLRRVVSRGLRWDEVEIVTTDPVAYGCALDVLATGMGIPATYAVGLPIERSRLGRALRTYLVWLEGGLHARPLWEALESGEIVPPDVNGQRPTRSGVARALRGLRIGWSVGRFREGLGWISEALKSGPELLSREEEDLEPGESGRRWERRALELRSLRVLLERLLTSLPPSIAGGVPAREQTGGAPTPEQTGGAPPVKQTRSARLDSRVHPGEPQVSAAELAQGALVFLGFFHSRGPLEEEMLERVREILHRVASVSTRPAPFAAAVAELRGHVAIRVPPPGNVGRQPWSSASGALHLTDLAHGGRAGRPFTFVVGMDADRAVRAAVEDPVLSDRERLALGRSGVEARNGRKAAPPAGLPTSSDLVEEDLYALAALFAGLRGEVTFSYSGWEASEGAILSPSPVLLQVLRVRDHNAGLGFEDLERILGEPVSAVPAGGRAVDDGDLWLAALSDGALLLDGEDLVRSGFPMLAAGVAGRRARGGDLLTPFHGRLSDVEGLDPREREEQLISATQLERLARCPLAWLYRHGLDVRKPEDPEYEPGRWLDAGRRGKLLHRVFERFGQAYRGRQHELDGADARQALARIVEDELARYRRLVPPPSPAAYAAQAEEIRDSAAAFLTMERESPEGVWEAFELAFGSEGAEPARIVLEDGRTLRVRGKIDRIDRLPDGSLRVIDYKTGLVREYEKSASDPLFRGGRRIQAGLYTRVVESQLGEKVRRFEYRFPTTRGENRAVAYEREELEATGRVVGSLLDMVAGGLLLATDDPMDCRYCDYRSVCRVRIRHGASAPDSPRAQWSREHGERLEEYAILRRLRESRR